ncbi:MAG: calcium-binding protein [Candidatus Baltobacteraceae bacterium]
MRIQSFLFTAAFVLLAGCGGGGGGTSALPASGQVSALSRGPFIEDWSNLPLAIAWIDSSVVGNWLARYNGFGTTQVVQGASGGKMLELSPRPSVVASETHAALVLSTQTFTDLQATAEVQTVAQLRASAPNPWETAWFLWHYQDDKHFYYLILKPNGWEVGKEDPLYPDAQRFLDTGTDRTFAIGSTNQVEIVQRGATISIAVNGSALTAITDTERPYLSGSVGLYCEDARVRFGAITVR